MVKVNLISGFLGTGKTTLIKKFLENKTEEKTTIIENEFGDVAIDGDLIKKDKFDVLELRSGCICCMMKQDFEDSIEKVIEEYRPDRIIIEPTGISSLSQVLDILKKDNLKEKININSPITLVDGTSYLEEKDVYGEFYMDQIKNADIIIVNKTKMIGQTTLYKVKESLKSFNEKADIITLPLEKFNRSYITSIFNKNLVKDIKENFAKIKVSTEEGFESLGIKTDKPFKIIEINNVMDKLFSKEYGNVIRAKGFLKGQEERLEINCTRKTRNIRRNKNNDNLKFCIIGQELNKEKIKSLFR